MVGCGRRCGWENGECCLRERDIHRHRSRRQLQCSSRCVSFCLSTPFRRWQHCGASGNSTGGGGGGGGGGCLPRPCAQFAPPTTPNLTPPPPLLLAHFHHTTQEP